jgi:septum site-determining protein MinD
MGRIISVISGKGGVGKTTVTANLGVMLASRNKNTVIVDCNISTSHLGMHFGLPPQRTNLNDVLRGEKTIEEAPFYHKSGVKIIPASLSKSDLEGVDMVYLRPIVKQLGDTHDFVLLDSAPGFERHAHSAMISSKEAIVVTTADLPSVIDVVRCTEVLDEMGVTPLGIVINMRGRGKKEMTNSEIEDLTGLKIIQEIPFDRNMQKAINARLPITIRDKRSKSSRAMMSLADKIIGMERISMRQRISRYFGF